MVMKMSSTFSECKSDEAPSILHYLIQGPILLVHQRFLTLVDICIFLFPLSKAVPDAPRNSHSFISANSTAASINLSSWKSNGCPIKHFSIQYKVKSKDSSDWILLSSNVIPEQRMIEIVDLQPGSWYSLLIVAHSDPGPTEKEYTFATLTDSGGK